MAVDTARARSKLLGLSLPRRGGPATNESTGLLFTLPIIFLFVAFNLLPTVYAFVVSLTTYNLFTPPTFVGFENYLDLLGNRNFWQAVGVTVGYTLLFGPASWILGFLIAMLLKDTIVGRDLFRSVFFVPTILSSVAMAVTWALLLRLNGPINGVLDISVPWLTNTQTALLGISLLGIWQSAGWFMVIFLAGLASIPESLTEAARIDGLRVFSPMFIMTGGGPANSTRSVAMLIYQEGLRDLRMGSAAAISVIGFVFILALTVIYFRVFRVREEIGY